MKRPTIFTIGALALVGVLFLATGCDQIELFSGQPNAKPVPTVKASSFKTRAQRRAYDGAPPVVAHQSFGVDCTTCHTAEGRVVPTVGIAPANPHLGDQHAGSLVNCRQCHVFAQTDSLFVDSDFAGLQQEYHPAERAHKLAPPVIPHPTSMRANCMACHSGQAARPQIVCTHPERTNCVQCHVESSPSTSIEMLGSLVE